MKPNNELIEKIEKFAPGLFAEAEAQEKKEILAARQEKAAALKKIHAQVEKDVSRLLGEQAQAQAAVKDAEAVLMEKRQEWGEVSAQLRGVRHQAERQAAELSRYLIETGDPGLDAAIRFFQERFEFLRGPGRLEVKKLATKKFLSGKKTSTWSSNKAAVEYAMGYCRNAIEAIEAMKLIPAFDAAAIETLKDELPEIATGP